MKTSKEWENIMFNNRTMTISSLVEQVQKEAYNEALEDAAKNADADVKFAGWGRECQLNSSEAWAEIDKQSILKLKK